MAAHSARAFCATPPNRLVLAIQPASIRNNIVDAALLSSTTNDDAMIIEAQIRALPIDFFVVDVPVIIRLLMFLSEISHRDQPNPSTLLLVTLSSSAKIFLPPAH